MNSDNPSAIIAWTRRAPLCCTDRVIDTALAPARRSGPLVGTSMAVGAMLSVQLGLGLSIGLADDIGPGGVTWLRLTAGGIVLLLIARPWTVRWSRSALVICVLLGITTAAMTSLFMLAATRIPLGTASALEFSGPLAIAVWRGRGYGRLWAVSAAVGILLLSRPWEGAVDGLGVLFALLAGGCWAAYIVLTDRAGAVASGIRPLGISIPVAAVAASLVWGWSAVPRLDLGAVALGVGAALLVPVLPFALELLALRRLPSATFSTLMSVEPAIAAGIGFLVLGQALLVPELLGIALVVLSSIGAERTNRVRVEPAPVLAG